MTRSFYIHSIITQNINKSPYFEFEVTISPEIMDVRARILNYTIFGPAKFHYIEKINF